MFEKFFVYVERCGLELLDYLGTVGEDYGQGWIGRRGVSWMVVFYFLIFPFSRIKRATYQTMTRLFLKEKEP